MTRYDVTNVFVKEFIEKNKNVWSSTLRATYFSINADNVKASSFPYSMESAEHALVVYSYVYTVHTQEDSSMFSIFFNANGDIEHYIEIDGWRLSFSSPITSDYRNYGTYCYISKGTIEGEIRIKDERQMDKCFDEIWKLFCKARNCETQQEIDFLIEMYKLNIDINELNDKNIKLEAEIKAKETIISSYKELLHKIEELVNK